MAAAGEALTGLRRLCAWAAAGGVLMVLAWLMPVHWKSLAPSVVALAGRGTPSLGEVGLALIAQEKPGPARLVLEAARSLKSPEAASLTSALADLSARKPALLVWGGADELPESLLQQAPAAAKPAGQPVLHLFLTEHARDRLRRHFHDQRPFGTQAILQTRELTSTTRFVPALQPGGQPYEATILLAGLLCTGDRISAGLTRDIKRAAAQAGQDQTSEAWEKVCLDLLALGSRLDWRQLIELLRLTPDLETMGSLARLAKSEPERLAVIYSACLLSQSPETVVKYLARFGPAGMDSLGRAMTAGEGAVRLLVRQQMPVGPAVGGEMAFLAPLALQAPELALGLKASGFALAILCFFVVWHELAGNESAEGLAALSRALRWRRAAVTLAVTMLALAASEPFLLPNAGAPQFNVHLQAFPVLANASPPTSENPPPKKALMHLDTSTVLSVALFAALQVIVYAVCLLRIREISRQSCPPPVKLRLMENEENLFDSGLYVGIAGTAAALILQVLGVIEANLLAAYSSNLFGILCVALVKIRHVRAFKRTLIMQSPAASVPPQPLHPAAA